MAHDMRHFIELAVSLSESAVTAMVPRWLRGKLYHGTARTDLAVPFSLTAVAFFTPDFDTAQEYAEMDAEIQEGDEPRPRIIEVRLNVQSPAMVDFDTLSDLHGLDEAVARLQAAGHDCAIDASGAKGQVAVFGSNHIRVVRIIDLDE